MLEITFYGVRGSTPCSCESTRRIGGNTSCVLVRLPDSPPIILDLGTGLRYLGEELKKELGSEPFSGTALVTHLHWDHIQGLPFFVPLLREGSELTVVGPPQSRPADAPPPSRPGQALCDAIKDFIKPPLFPVELDHLPGTFDFVETDDASLAVGSAVITAGAVAHVGATNGYRIETESGSVAYVPDHQAPIDGSLDVPSSVIDLCRGVDVLIHDAQYDNEEFQVKAGWGHSTIDYAVAVARAAEVGRLVLFHHDPTHDDAWVDEAVEHARAIAGPDLDVLAAYEGMTLRSGAELPV